MTAAGEAFTDLVLQVFRFNGLLLAAGDGLTRELGLTSALWQVLGAIDRESRTMAQIARQMGRARQSVRRSAHVLQEKGFVCFQDNPDHQRARLVCLTSRGREVLDRMYELNAEWANQTSGRSDAREIRQAVQLLETLCSRLDGGQ